MKNIHSTLCAIALSALTIGSAKAVAPDPRWLQHLQETGDTAQLNAIKHHYDAMQQHERQMAAAYAPQAGSNAVPLNIAPNGLVVLINFQDVSFTTPFEEMQKMTNGDNYERNYEYVYYGSRYRISAKGSARQYFIDQSHGLYQPQFDVVGPYTVAHDMAYYGANGQYGNDTRVHEVIIEACQLADADGVDFTKYDCNNDGDIDFVYVIYAGYGEADGGGSNTIWPHTSSVLYYTTVRLDGKRLGTYACGSELGYISKQHQGIGTFCHEFSHVLGLPDMYSTDKSSNHKTMGDWDILDSGSYNNDSNTPSAMSAYERFFLGWLEPELLNKPQSVTLEDIQKSNKAYLITSDGTFDGEGNNPDPKEFYLLHNVQKNGWNQYIPGHGLMVTKVNFSYSKWIYNKVNSNADDLGVDIIEADGSAPKLGKTGYSGKQGDLFPYHNDKKDEHEDSYLCFKNYPLTKIVEDEQGIIHFNFMGGDDAISALAIEMANEDSDIHYNKIVALYDHKGDLISVREDEDLNLNGLAPGLYIIRLSTDDEVSKKRQQYKSVKIMIH